ncbi:MAG: hypothetical protein OZ928_17600 [Polyangiaceae bacterium]|nr:hypothetical protein [Polyangiaceae bacterium]
MPTGGKIILLAPGKAKNILAKLEVDRLQPKPAAAILGESWAMNYGERRQLRCCRAPRLVAPWQRRPPR